jgi:hypothetical protein
VGIAHLQYGGVVLPEAPCEASALVEKDVTHVPPRLVSFRRQDFGHGRQARGNRKQEVGGLVVLGMVTREDAREGGERPSRLAVGDGKYDAVGGQAVECGRRWPWIPGEVGTIRPERIDGDQQDVISTRVAVAGEESERQAPEPSDHQRGPRACTCTSIRHRDGHQSVGSGDARAPHERTIAVLSGVGMPPGSWAAIDRAGRKARRTSGHPGFGLSSVMPVALFYRYPIAQHARFSLNPLQVKTRSHAHGITSIHVDRKVHPRQRKFTGSSTRFSRGGLSK